MDIVVQERSRRERILNLILYCLAAGFLVAAAVCLHLGWNRESTTEPQDAAASAPPVRSDQATPAFGRRLLAVPMFKQWDQAWGDDGLGGSGEKLRFAGCTVSCVAMVFRHGGLDTDPGRLNAWLIAHGGYTAGGLLRWEKCVEYAGGRLALDYHGDPDLAYLHRSLAAGRPAIVKIRLEGGMPHWVVVVGNEGRELLVNDPLGAAPGPSRLSDFGSQLYAMRVFRPAG
jgi:hypothetical protein